MKKLVYLLPTLVSRWFKGPFWGVSIPNSLLPGCPEAFSQRDAGSCQRCVQELPAGDLQGGWVGRGDVESTDVSDTVEQCNPGPRWASVFQSVQRKGWS